MPVPDDVTPEPPEPTLVVTWHTPPWRARDGWRELFVPTAPDGVEQWVPIRPLYPGEADHLPDPSRTPPSFRPDP